MIYNFHFKSKQLRFPRQGLFLGRPILEGKGILDE